MKPSFKEKKGISEKVADYIKEQIRLGVYPEGDKIPSERDMAISLDVSRNTVGEAYKILEAYGYLKAEHGRGVFIASEAEQIRKMTDAFFVSGDQINDLYAVRLVLEEAVVEWAVLNGTDEQIAALDSIVNDAIAAVKDDSNSADVANYDLRFHLCLAEMSKNEVANRIMHHLIDLLAKARTQSMQIPKRAEQSVQEHSVIVEAIKNRDVDGAKKAMRHHIESIDKSVREKRKHNRGTYVIICADFIS